MRKGERVIVRAGVVLGAAGSLLCVSLLALGLAGVPFSVGLGIPVVVAGLLGILFLPITRDRDFADAADDPEWPTVVPVRPDTVLRAQIIWWGALAHMGVWVAFAMRATEDHKGQPGPAPISILCVMGAIFLTFFLTILFSMLFGRARMFPFERALRTLSPFYWVGYWLARRVRPKEEEEDE